jgi:hypothetical protein
MHQMRLALPLAFKLTTQDNPTQTLDTVCTRAGPGKYPRRSIQMNVMPRVKLVTFSVKAASKITRTQRGVIVTTTMKFDT